MFLEKKLIKSQFIILQPASNLTSRGVSDKGKGKIEAVL